MFNVSHFLVPILHEDYILLHSKSMKDVKKKKSKEIKNNAERHEREDENCKKKVKGISESKHILQWI